MPSNAPLSINTPSNIKEDLYYALNLRGQSLLDNRPILNIGVSIDLISFYVGAIGSVCMGYLLGQYEPRNIDNIAYVNEQGMEIGPGRVVMKFIRTTLSHPLSIIQRFFFGGATYVFIGFLTNRFLGRARPIACGALTGLYFGYGEPFTSMLQAVGGFAVFAFAMEYFSNVYLT